MDVGGTAADAAQLYKDMILVLGGELPPSHTFPENEGYDGKLDRWVTLAPMPAGRHGFGGAVIGFECVFRWRLTHAGRWWDHRPADHVQPAVSGGRPPAVSSKVIQQPGLVAASCGA
jgi:hypothetical protein